jgi:hypothetical protein
VVVSNDPKQVREITRETEHILERELEDTATVIGVVSEIQIATHKGSAHVALVVILHEEMLTGREAEITAKITNPYQHYTVFATVLKSLPWSTGSEIMMPSRTKS